MTKIVPTITANNPEEYAFQLERLAFASRIHVDITDGDLAPSQTVNLNQIYWDRSEILREIDLHLMMRRPIEWLHQIVALAPDLVILHAESDNALQDLPRMAKHLRKFGIKFGVAVLPETGVRDVYDLIKIADYVLVFGGHLGYQGGKADLNQLEKVAKTREILNQVQNGQCEIAWDGGANLKNVAEIAAAGVDVINVGSAIMRNQNPEQSYRELVSAVSDE